MEPALIAGYPIILPEHRAVFHRERPDWHKHWLDSIHESLKSDAWVHDVGAEQGDLAALVASWIPDGQIILWEPQPKYWPTIRATFEANGLKPPRMSVVGFASDEWDMRGVDQLVWSGWPAVSYDESHPDPGFYHLNEHDIPRNRIDTVGIVGADALIVDVEGAEYAVLKGAEEVLRDSQPTVWCAIHPEIMHDRYGHDPNELLAFMYRLGYRWEFLGFQSELHFKFTPR